MVAQLAPEPLEQVGVAGHQLDLKFAEATRLAARLEHGDEVMRHVGGAAVQCHANAFALRPQHAYRLELTSADDAGQQGEDVPRELLAPSLELEPPTLLRAASAARGRGGSPPGGGA